MVLAYFKVMTQHFDCVNNTRLQKNNETKYPEQLASTIKHIYKYGADMLKLAIKSSY
jgi:hypothetical protein